MPYDESLAERIRLALKRRRGISEKKLFGGVAFLVYGNMLCGVVAHSLVVRVGPDAHERALARPHAREMDFTGRAMKGMVYVSTEGFEADEDLEAWLARGSDFAGSLPSK